MHVEISLSSYFRSHYAEHYKQICLELMQGEPIDSENSLVTLVDSVALPLIEQLNTPLYPVTESTENFVFINELRMTEFLYLFSRLVKTCYFFSQSLNYQRTLEMSLSSD